MDNAGNYQGAARDSGRVPSLRVRAEHGGSVQTESMRSIDLSCDSGPAAAPERYG
jgi:hypothetical protein